jgi:membrane associated rhomboid family serine protease
MDGVTNATQGGEFGGGPLRSPGPIINAPRVVVALIGVFVLVHVVRLLVSPAMDDRIVLTLAFIPVRYLADAAQFGEIPGGPGAAIWSFVTHALVHADWLHLGINSVWMLAFGSVLARRLGAWRFLVFSALAAAAGAGASLWLHWGQVSVLIGASGAISGQMAGAVRLIFALPQGLRGMGTSDLSQVSPLSLSQTFRNRQALVFLGVWLGLALVTGALNINPASADQSIAWEAHVGGFVAGLFLFGLMDRRRTA